MKKSKQHVVPMRTSFVHIFIISINFDKMFFFVSVSENEHDAIEFLCTVDRDIGKEREKEVYYSNGHQFQCSAQTHKTNNSILIRLKEHRRFRSVN